MRRHPRSLRDRGAGLVEYALAVALIVSASLGAIQYLEDQTADEVDNQASCLSTRPPPPTDQCVQSDLVRDGGANQAPGGANSGGGSPIQENATLGPPTVNVVAAPPLYEVTLTVDLMDDANQPLEGVVMTALVTITQSSASSRIGEFFYVDCVTDAAGRCQFEFDSRFPTVTEVSIDIVSAGEDVSYDFGDFDPPVLVAKP